MSREALTVVALALLLCLLCALGVVWDQHLTIEQLDAVKCVGEVQT